jgi:hypothetical protein
MRQTKRIALHVALVLALATLPLMAQQEPPPKEAFKTVHLVTLTPTEASTLLAALTDTNAAIAKAGHSDIRYRLYKVSGKQSGKNNYLWEASWPSGAVYAETHKSPAFEEVLKKHPELEKLRKKEIYNRYVEVTGDKP